MKTPEEWISDKFVVAKDEVICTTKTHLHSIIASVQKDALAPPKKVKREGWINVYPPAFGGQYRYTDAQIWDKKEDADRADKFEVEENNNPPRITVVKITWEE